MSPRAIILGLAALFAIAGLSFGLTTVHSGDTSCGSALQPQSTTFQADLDAIDQGDRATGCHDAISGRKPIAYGSLGIAAIALIVGFTASSSKPTNADGSEKPSIWR